MKLVGCSDLPVVVGMVVVVVVVVADMKRMRHALWFFQFKLSHFQIKSSILLVSTIKVKITTTNLAAKATFLLLLDLTGWQKAISAQTFDGVRACVVVSLLICVEIELALAVAVRAVGRIMSPTASI